MPEPDASPRPATTPDVVTSVRFVAVVPVKPPALGKSRLVGLTDDRRRELAEAFALDTVAAAAATAGVEAVLVVTDDFRLAGAMRGLGAEVMPDGVSEDLNATLVQAAAEVVRRWPGAVPVALCADLPGLLPDELTVVLADATAEVSAGRAAFVRDRTGTGTTMYAAAADAFAPSFGPGSAAAHEWAGAVEVGSAATSVRADVDDRADLGAALVAGVGPHTTRASGRRATPPG
jgi:2-phospho-L-lactate guanylyltransferase